MPRLATFLLLFLLAACGSDPAPAGAAPSADAPDVDAPDAAGPLAPALDPSVAADDNTTYVLVLGNSLTAGFGLDDPATQSYPALLQARADEAGLDARIVNAGVSGDTSAGGARRIEWILQRQPVDVLVLALGGNDGLRGLPTDAMAANFATIIEEVRERYPDADVVVAGMEAPPNMGEAYVSDFRGVFREVAAEYDAALVPFLLDGVGGVAAMNQPDGIHPTAEGQERLAANVWPVLEGVLR